MNRRERRSVEKKMGITEYKRKLPLDQRMAIISQNIANGKNKQGITTVNKKVEEQKNLDQAISNKVASLATTLMLKEGISYVDALEKAKIQVEKEYSVQTK